MDAMTLALIKKLGGSGGGGGSGVEEVYVGTDTPPEGTKVWINPNGVATFPMPTAEDAGKVLKAKGANEAEWGDAPSGGGGASEDVWETIIDTTLEADVTALTISQDINGNPFSLKELTLFVVQPPIVGQTANNRMMFMPYNGSWGGAGQVRLKDSPKETDSTVYSFVHLNTVDGRENILQCKVSSNYSSVTNSLVDMQAPTSYDSTLTLRVNLTTNEMLFGPAPFTMAKFIGLGGTILGAGTRILMRGVRA